MTSCKLVFKIFGIENLIHLKSFKERHVPFFMNTLMNCKIAFNVIKNYCYFLSQELLKEIISLPIYRVRKNVNEKEVKKQISCVVKSIFFRPQIIAVRFKKAFRISFSTARRDIHKLRRKMWGGGNKPKFNVSS